MKCCRVIAVSFGLFFAVTAQAYELATHGRLTYNAYLQSVLAKDDSLLKDLGLTIQNPLTDESFGATYFDFTDSEVKTRYADPFESSNGRIPNEVKPLSLPGWLLRGAIREDDVLEPDNGQPVDDPYNTGNVLLDNRVLNHFYDPVHDRPLTVGAVLGKKAPDWASGTNDVFSQPNVPETGRRNHFTVFDAREAMYRALTGKNKNGDDVAATKDDRNKYWATLFRALGDIAHLVQDMAQPQHTRNDPHFGHCAPIVTGHASVYEKYIETRAAAKEFELPSGDKFIPPPLNYTGYATPRFTDYLSYFTTRRVDGDVMARRGLADYSNRGFFSAGKNLNPFDAQYDYPSNNAPSYGRRAVQTNWLGQPFGGTMTLFIGSVPDSLTGQTDTGVPLTAIGAWDQFLEQKNLLSQYTLVRDNYDAMADLLIPRAVAYSAGLIDYFFRGRIEAEDAHYTDTGIELKVKNTLDPEKYPEWKDETLYAKTGSDTPSTLRIVYEYRDENGVTRYGASDAVDMKVDQVNGDDDIAPGKISKNVYSFTLTVPSGKIRNLKYRLVFRGRLGQEEDAVVVGAFKPASGFLVTPNYPPQDGIPGARMIYKTATGWKLAPDEGLVAGNIDWKGWYDATTGKPAKALSWKGPQARYFPDREFRSSDNHWYGQTAFEHEIYRSGELFAVAPGEVLGAALARDSAGDEWLIAICKENNEDVVYRRPNRKSDSPAKYDPETTPDGWREIGRFNAGAEDGGLAFTSGADVPWFFNGDGTAAQTMRRWWKFTDSTNIYRLKRLRINIINDVTSAEISNLDNLSGFIGNGMCTESFTMIDGGKEQGSAQSSSNMSGEYLIAVDYKNNTEVFAKIVHESSSSQISTINGKSGTYVSSSSSTDRLVLDSMELQTYAQINHDNISWNDGVHTGSSGGSFHHKYVTYYLDLRDNLYVYSSHTSSYNDTIAGGVSSYSAKYSVAAQLSRGLIQTTDIYSEIFPDYTSDGPYAGDTPVHLCTGNIFLPPSWTVGPVYGPMNFGATPPIGGPYAISGSWAVDALRNLAVSQKYYGGDYYNVLGPFNYLEGAADPKSGLESAIQTAPPGADFHPLGVVW